MRPELNTIELLPRGRGAWLCFGSADSAGRTRWSRPMDRPPADDSGLLGYFAATSSSV